MKKKRKKEVSVRSTYCRFSLAFLCLVPTPACGNLQGLPPHSQSGFLSCFAGAPMIGLVRDLQWGGLCFEFCGPTPVPLRGLFFRRLTQPRARAISLISTRRTPFLDWHSFLFRSHILAQQHRVVEGTVALLWHHWSLPVRVAVLSLRSPTPQSPVPGIQGKWNIEAWLLACVVDSTHEVSGSSGSRKLDKRVQLKCNYGVLAWLGYVTLLVGCVGYQQLSCRCLVTQPTN